MLHITRIGTSYSLTEVQYNFVKKNSLENEWKFVHVSLFAESYFDRGLRCKENLLLPQNCMKLR